MRYLILLSALFICSLCAAQPMAYFDYKVFNTGQETYVETYFDFSSPSLNYRELPNGRFQARVGVTILILQNDSIITFRKIETLSPETQDSAFVDFMDLQRISVAPGKYDIEIELIDLYRTTDNTVKFKQPLTIAVPQKEVYTSEALFIGDVKPAAATGKFTKGNQDIYPLITDYFPEEITTLMFYQEIYNSDVTFRDSTGAFVVVFKITNPKTGSVFREFQRIRKQKTGPVVPFIGNIDIKGLPSGEYELVTDLRNTKNETLYSSKRKFKRSNMTVVISDAELQQLMLNNSFVSTVNNLDSLSEYINCLRPIANDREKNAIDNQKEVLKTLEDKKRFFYTFWATKNPIDPSQGWQDYKNEVNLVNKMFSTRIKKGYSTDRGRVYLQYGPPNVRTERPTEPSAYPYEIWHYYKINQYANKRFVFWNQDLVSNDYELLHSDMFGEPRNPSWQTYLSKRNNSIDNYDRQKPVQQFGGNANDFYINPR